MSTITSVAASMGAAPRAQVEVGVREPSQGFLARVLEKVTCPLLGQGESVIAEVRATLEGQVVSRFQDRALLCQEGGFPRQSWRKEKSE